MNHQLWNRVAARVVAIAFVVGGLAACGDHRISNTHAKAPSSNAADASAVVVGTAPAQPSGDPPGTTPVAPNTSDVSPQQESTKRPLEGDNHSYSTVAPTTPQKTDGNSSADQRGNQ